MNDYIIITPVKNEQEYLQKVILSVTNQTVLPKLWIIIDGGSTDKTRDIIKTFAEKYPWIHLRHQTRFSNEGGHVNVSLAADEAYSYVVKYCDDNRIGYDYIWTIDGDQWLSSQTCEGIIKRMELDKTIGAATGTVLNPGGVPDIYPEGELPNKRVYTRAAIETIGGFPVTKYSYDTVILAKLRIAGKAIVTFPEYRIQNLRDDSGTERNRWKSHVQFGKARYYLGYSFLLLILGCGYLAKQKKIGKAIGIFYGYMDSWIFRDEQIEDKEIRNHFGKERLREILGAVQIHPRHTVYAAIIGGVWVIIIFWMFHVW